MTDRKVSCHLICSEVTYWIPECIFDIFVIRPCFALARLDYGSTRQLAQDGSQEHVHSRT